MTIQGRRGAACGRSGLWRATDAGVAAGVRRSGANAAADAGRGRWAARGCATSRRRRRRARRRRPAPPAAFCAARPRTSGAGAVARRPTLAERLKWPIPLPLLAARAAAAALFESQGAAAPRGRRRAAPVTPPRGRGLSPRRRSRPRTKGCRRSRRSCAPRRRRPSSPLCSDEDVLTCSSNVGGIAARPMAPAVRTDDRTWRLARTFRARLVSPLRALDDEPARQTRRCARSRPRHLPAQARWRALDGPRRAAIFAAAEPVKREALARIVGRAANLEALIARYL